MNSYNGFSPQLRNKSLVWYKVEVKAGRRQWPTVCEACGQTEGIIDAHSEDYSEPFGDHIGQYGLCYLCHLMLHCRFKNPDAWNRYRAEIQAGRRYAAVFTRDFGVIVRLLNGQDVASTCHDAPTRDVFAEMGL